MVCRFVGTHVQIMDTKIKMERFGQLVDLPDEFATRRAHVLTADEWASLGVTDEEMKKFPTVEAIHLRGTPEIKAKLVKAWAILHEPLPGTVQSKPESISEVAPQ